MFQFMFVSYCIFCSSRKRYSWKQSTRRSLETDGWRVWSGHSTTSTRAKSRRKRSPVSFWELKNKTHCISLKQTYFNSLLETENFIRIAQDSTKNSYKLFSRELKNHFKNVWNSGTYSSQSEVSALRTLLLNTKIQVIPHSLKIIRSILEVGHTLDDYGTVETGKFWKHWLFTKIILFKCFHATDLQKLSLNRFSK